MNKVRKAISIFTLLTLMLLTFATPVHAFEGREGDKVVIVGVGNSIGIGQ